MFWLIFFFVMLLLLGTLFFATIKIGLSTIKNLYFVSFGRFITASASLVEDDVLLRFYLFGFSKQVSLLQMLAGAKRKKSFQEKVTDAVVKSSKKRVPITQVWNLLKSFRVKRFYLNLDFNNAFYNAWLYPLGEIFKSKNVHFTTNFERKTEIEIEIINRPAWMLWAIAKSQFKTKKS